MTSLPAHLIKNSGVVSEVEKSKGICVCHTWLIRRGKSLPATEKSNQDLLLNLLLSSLKRKLFPAGFLTISLTWSVFARLIPVWTLTSSVLSEAHAFIAFTMADKPTDKTSPLTGGEKTSFQVILKILMGVKIAELNSHNCKLDFWGAVLWSVHRVRRTSAKAPLCDQARRAWWVDR